VREELNADRLQSAANARADVGRGARTRDPTPRPSSPRPLRLLIVVPQAVKLRLLEQEAWREDARTVPPKDRRHDEEGVYESLLALWAHYVLRLPWQGDTLAMVGRAVPPLELLELQHFVTLGHREQACRRRNQHSLRLDRDCVLMQQSNTSDAP
jgi:hypothetical protein